MHDPKGIATKHSMQRTMCFAFVMVCSAFSASAQNPEPTSPEVRANCAATVELFFANEVWDKVGALSCLRSWKILFNRQGSPGGTVSIRQGATPAFTATLTNEVKSNDMPAGLAVSFK